MHHSSYLGALLGLLELAVPFYGLRLSRKFGTKQIGWALVSAFSALALARFMGVSVVGIRPEGDVAGVLLYGVVPLLLLIGLAHVETLYRERKRAEGVDMLGQSLARAEERRLATPQFDPMAYVAAAAAQHFNRHVGVINLYASLLLRKGYDGRTAAHHKRIAEEAERALELGKLLLSTNGSHPQRHNRVSLLHLITQATPALRRALGPEIRLEIKCRRQLPAIMADAAQIGFMLDQLVRNAGEASKPGAAVAISAGVQSLEAREAQLHPGARAGEFVFVSVSDTGSGMSEETQQQMFVPFFTTKDALRHPGLGLPSVCGMVKKHGGWMDIESALRRGTKVQLFFPVAE